MRFSDGADDTHGTPLGWFIFRGPLEKHRASREQQKPCEHLQWHSISTISLLPKQGFCFCFADALPFACFSVLVFITAHHSRPTFRKLELQLQ